MVKLSKYEIRNLIDLYLDGDNKSADVILRQYDSLIKRTALDYFEGKLDLQIGWALEDVIQFSRIRILQAMKKLNLEKCPFPHFIKVTTIWACNRFIRYSTMQKRDHEKQVEFNGILALFIQDKSIKLPEDITMEKELMERLEEAISKLDEVCQAVYFALMSGNSPRGYDHPLLKTRGGSSVQNKLNKVRCAVREVLTTYNAN